MTINLLARLTGLAVTLCILLAFVARAAGDAEWSALYRAMLTRQEGSADGGAPRIWRWYVSRLRRHADLTGRAFDGRTAALRLAGLAGVFILALLLFHQAPPMAVLLGSVLALVLTERVATRRFRKAREGMLYAFLYEAVPLALHSLTATGELDRAFIRMAALTRYAPLRARLEDLARLCTLPQYGTPEDAFLDWGARMRIDEIRYFALATRRARRHDPSGDMAGLWSRMVDVLGKDLEYRRQIRAMTAGHRVGAYLFYGILVGGYLLGYPFLVRYLSGGMQVGFWTVIVIMTLGLWLVVRRSEAIDA